MENKILLELRKNLNNLKISMINNSIVGEKAKTEYNKILFAAKVLRNATKKVDLDQTTYNSNVEDFICELINLKLEFEDVLNQVELEDEMVEEFKAKLPERIHTDSELEL